MSGNPTGSVKLGSRSEIPHPVVLAIIGPDGLPVAVGLESLIPVSDSNIPGAAIPPHDTIIDSPTNALVVGGTRTWKMGGASGTIVAQVAASVSGGDTTLQRTV